MRQVRDYMEPVLVRKGEKYPEKDHMYTYLTFVLLCGNAPDEDVQKAVRRFRYDRGYLFSVRGHAEARLVLADLAGQQVFTNAAGRSLKKMYEKAFTDTENGEKGYNELYLPQEQRPDGSI